MLSSRTGLLLVAVLLALVPPPAPADEPEPLPAGALARLGSGRFRHSYPLSSAALSPDGKVLAAAGQGGDRIQLWDVATGKPLRHIKLPNGRATFEVLFAHDGKSLATAGFDGIHLWNAESGDAIRQIAPPGGRIMFRGIRGGFAWSPDDKLLALGNFDGSISLFDAATGGEVRQLKVQGGNVASVAFSPDGKHLASGGHDGGLRLWDPGTGQEVRVLNKPSGAGGFSAQFESLAFSPDGKILATGGDYNHPLILWDVGTGKPLQRLNEQRGPIRSVAFSPNGKFVAGAGVNDRSVRLWGVASGKELRTFDGHGGMVHTVLFSPDGKRLFTAAADNTVRVWDLATATECYPATGHTGMITALIFMPDGKRLVSGGADGSVRVWDGDRTGKTPGRFGKEVDRATEVSGPVQPGLAADGKSILWGNVGYLQSWQPGGAREQRQVGSVGNFGLAALSPEGGLLAVAGAPFAATNDNQIHVYNVDAGKEVRLFKGLPAYVQGLSWSADGSVVGVRDNQNSVYLLDMETGRRLRPFAPQDGNGAPLTMLGLSPDGRLAATGNDGLALFEAATGKERYHAARGNQFQCLAFSADGRLVATANQEGKIFVLDAVTGEELAQWTGHLGMVNVLAFSRDGKLLASGGRDATVMLWDAGSLKSSALADKLTTEEMESLWKELGNADATKAHRAVWALAAAREQVAGFLKDRMRPAKGPDAKQVAKLIADLDNDDFDVRQKATDDLEAMGAAIVPALRTALEKDPSVEARNRLTVLLEKLSKDGVSGEEARAVRVLEVLEKAGTAEARELLRKLAQGEDNSPLTPDARAALKRLEKRGQ
jgi:WD40 repeat protein